MMRQLAKEKVSERDLKNQKCKHKIIIKLKVLNMLQSRRAILKIDKS